MSHLTSKFKSTPTITFKSRSNTITASNQANLFPSPSTYSNNYHAMANHLQPSSKFSKQRRSSLPHNNSQTNPGPGSYEFTQPVYNSSFNKTEILNKGQVRFKLFKDVTPGPSQYLVNKPDKKAPEFSIGKVQRSLKDICDAANTNPSPNNYSPRPLDSITKPIGFPKAVRKENIQSEKTPGPASYLTENSMLSTTFNQKNDLLSRSKRSYSSSKLETVPGPGAYQKPNLFAEQIRKGKGFTWEKRYSTPIIDSPGPGYYDSGRIFSSKLKQHGGVKMAKSQRFLWNNDVKQASHTPGPGDHETFYEQTSKFRSVSASKFPKTKLPHFTTAKNDKFQSFINPEKLDSGRKSTPSYSVSALRRKQLYPRKDTPDTFYDSSIKLTSKSQVCFKIGKSQKLQPQKTNALGPGQYNPQRSMLSSKKMKFSKQKRTTFLDEVIKSKLDTFRGQTYEEREQFPNPPKYMNVHSKLQVNESKLGKY